MTEKNDIIIDIYPTIFPQFNKQNNLANDHKTSSITVKRLKHGHLRNMQRLNENEQIHFLMAQLTNLSQSDLDELDIEDSAKLSEIILGFMRHYADIAKNVIRN